ncbi:STAS domain-containing protein [Streptomyces sp. NPDC002701]|uniref:STAS domain-containing protein n=1 Tax=Streptomyces sp. NPDC002701 TaxID=3364661 RepID=UPI0036A38D76
MAKNNGPARDSQFSIVSAATDGIRVLTVRGEIDRATAPDLLKALTPDDDTTAMRIILDLKDVTFMDSTGINTLLTAHQTAQRTHGWLRLAAPTEAVLRVIQIVRLDHLIPSYPTLRQALHP